MLAKLRAALRYRRELRSLAAPSPDPRYFSRFRGLWTDRRDAGDELGRRAAAGLIADPDVERLRHWIDHGWVVLEGAVAPEVCDVLRADLDHAFRHGDERLLTHSPSEGRYVPLTGGLGQRGRVVDVYVHYESARRALFSAAIVDFLRLIFEDSPVLFQSLSFERGSEQPLHQDTAFVVVSSPMELAASWIALEDIEPGSGELAYLDGSHRLPEYLFSGKYKSWNAKRDGEAQEAEWRESMYRNAERLGLPEKRFVPRKGDVLIWSADLAHGGAPVTDPSLTRRSLVGHYCPARVEPLYFRLRPEHGSTAPWDGCRYASQHYQIAT